MNGEKNAFVLASHDAGAPSPVLTGVKAEGRLDGVLFELALRQTYRNTSERVLEVVYTFPLPHQAVLLGFAAELNGERKVGTIVAKREAERLYEDALAEGDAPVMLEALDGGLHTANIGNLKPGDEIVLEARFAQLLAFEQGRLRLAIPTTIAPRYGSAELGGLQPQQVPQASMAAEYPLALSVTVAGSLAGATVECPTHRFTRAAVDGGIRLDLDRGASLDRDVVILVQPKETRPSLVIQSADAVSKVAPLVLMAALQPPVTAPRDQIAIKLLVDCSGSMGGDSITSARAALRGVLGGLTDRDRVSLSRFGSEVEHVLAPAECSPRTLRHLAPLVDAIEADLGGTEMEKALRSVFELPGNTSHRGADVLLITDGEVWQAEEMIAAAKASGHRVFAIGVGTSPADGVLRSLAEATGGACEFATPGEALEAAARRMLGRIRQQPWRDVRIDWGGKTAWQSAVPAAVFGGDTVFAFAGAAARAQASAVRLLATDALGATTELARGEADAPCPGDSLPRIAASRRMSGAEDRESLMLAIDYQLMSKQTNCILVHRRAEADKATEQAELHRVSSMLAAGWGATSTVMESASMDYAALSTPSVWRSARRSADSDIRFSLASADDFEIPAFLRKQSEDMQPASLKAIAEAVSEHLSHGGRVQGLAAHCEAMDLHADVRLVLDQAVDLGLCIGDAWLLLAHWANRRPGALADSAITEALRPHLDGIGADLFDRCMKLFDRVLGAYESDSWTLSRARRLRRALTRTLP